MKDVRVGAMAVYGRCVGTADANVVKHGSLVNELCVGPQFRMPTHYVDSFLSDV